MKIFKKSLFVIALFCFCICGYITLANCSDKDTGKPISHSPDSLQGAMCSIQVGYIISAKTRFYSANENFDRDITLTPEQIDPFMSDGKTFGQLKCPVGGKLIIGSLNQTAKCTIHTPDM